MDKPIERIEIEFFNLLSCDMEKGEKLLQIKPEYLSTQKHQELLKAMIYSKENKGKICLEGMASYKLEIIDDWIDLMNEEVYDVILDKTRFNLCQELILSEYKKRALADLNVKLNQNKISFEVYSSQVVKANGVNISYNTKYLTKEEIEENISVEQSRIRLKNFGNLDNLLKLVQGDFLIIGATTGTGKSGLLLNIMNDLMDKYQCIYFNMEMSKSTIYKRLISIKSNIQIYDIEQPKSEYQRNIISKAIEEIEKAQIIVEHKAGYLQEIKSILARQKDNKKHTIIFLDHIGLIKNMDKKSIYEQTTEIAKQLRQFCLDYDCTIISASQLNRTSQSAETLNLSMLKDSGELENSASKVILLYKDKDNVSKEKYVENMILDIVKNRDGQLGKIACKYNKTKQIFKEENNYND